MRILVIITFLLSSLGGSSQALVKDASFQPFFDIRSGFSKGYINDIYESPQTGSLYIVGTFDTFFGPNSYGGYVSTRADGSHNSNFLGNTVYNDLVGGIKRINDTNFILITSGNYVPIDTSGNLNMRSWWNNRRYTVYCATGFSPYFFPDGSSLMANTINNTGKPCDIINPPDTFPGRHIVKVDPQGLWDSTFTHDANRAPRGFAPYDSNQILVYGFPFRFTHYDSVKVDGLCRIYLDGTLDTTFQSPLSDGFDAGGFNPLLFESDGGFFLQGRFKLKGDTTTYAIVRLNQDGSIDSTYQYQNGPIDTTGYSGGASISPTHDGGYFVYGVYNKMQGVPIHGGLAKVDSNGVLDPNYFTGLGPDSSTFGGNIPGYINKILPSKFGGYYVVGNFLKWDGQPSQPIVRLIDNTVGLESPKPKAESLKLFPNPTENQITLSSVAKIEAIEVYDLLGKRVKEVQSLNTHQQTLNLQEVENGLYFIKIKVGEQWISKKVVKR
ncbi:MAG: T9SS type A sorting domain-containing protein [Vicingaceae bacterium]